MSPFVRILFDFDITSTAPHYSQVLINDVATSASLAYSEKGVNYTLSIVNGDGNNSAEIFKSYSSSSTVAFSSMHLDNKAGAAETFIFDVNGPDSIGSFSNVKIFVSRATGWTLNGQALVNGPNNLSGTFENLSFSNSNANALLSVSQIQTTLMCFCADTMIATPTGVCAVQDLAVGDQVSKADGGATTVKWLGEQAVDVRLTNPKKVNPICISAGALGAGLPLRDLIVSQDHAIEIDGLLVNAGALVNGSTIYQVANMPLDGFSYYHIDTGAHELLLAEGVAAESFIDYASRDSFDGKGAATDMIPEMPLPRISSARMLPDAIKAKLRTATPKVA